MSGLHNGAGSSRLAPFQGARPCSPATSSPGEGGCLKSGREKHSLSWSCTNVLWFDLAAKETGRLAGATMSQTTELPQGLTLEDVANYLRLPKEIVDLHADRGQIPGRCI